MGTIRELTPAEKQTVQVLKETLENIKGWENEIANPPDDASEFKAQLTPQGFQMVKVPGEGEGARVDRLENKIYDAKAQALTTIEKNNAELPEADRQQLQKESTVALYSDKRSLELISDKNVSVQRSPGLSQEKDMALLAQEYRRQMNEPGTVSAGVRMSLPELFEPADGELSLDGLDLSELQFKQNAYEVTGHDEHALQIDAAIENRMIEGPSIEDMISARLDDMYALNASDITEPDIEPTEPGDD